MLPSFWPYSFLHIQSTWTSQTTKIRELATWICQCAIHKAQKSQFLIYTIHKKQYNNCQMYRQVLPKLTISRVGSGWNMILVTTPLWPLKKCVQNPPSTSHTSTFLSAPAVASNPPDASQAMPITGPSCPYTTPHTKNFFTQWISSDNEPKWASFVSTLRDFITAEFIIKQIIEEQKSKICTLWVFLAGCSKPNGKH